MRGWSRDRHPPYLLLYPLFFHKWSVRGGEEGPGTTIHLTYFYTLYSSISGQCEDERRVQGPPSTYLLLYSLFFHQWSARGGKEGPGTTMDLAYFVLFFLSPLVITGRWERPETTMDLTTHILSTLYSTEVVNAVPYCTHTLSSDLLGREELGGSKTTMALSYFVLFLPPLVLLGGGRVQGPPWISLTLILSTPPVVNAREGPGTTKGSFFIYTHYSPIVPSKVRQVMVMQLP
jgi:hypothetical protein